MDDEDADWFDEGPPVVDQVVLEGGTVLVYVPAVEGAWLECDSPVTLSAVR